MATHCSIPAWEIPWTEEPVGNSLWSRKESDMTEHTHIVLSEQDQTLLIFECSGHD